MKTVPLTTLETVNDSLKELIASFDKGIDYEHENFLTLAQLKGLQWFVDDKVKEYSDV